VRGLCFLIFLLFNPAVSFSEASANPTQTVYCIGNHDATGACWKAGSGEDQKLGCLITSWPIVECQSIPESEEKTENYECLALQNTGIVNQISLSCQSLSNNAADEKIDSNNLGIPQSTPQPESTSTPDAADQSTVLELQNNAPNVFQPGLNNSTFGVEQPKDFKDAF